MSFSSELKEELNNINNLKNKECIKYELIGYLLTSNTVMKNSKFIYKTESEYSINRYSRLLSNVAVKHNIEIKGKIFSIIVKKDEIEKYLSFDIKKEKIKNEEEIKALIRGVFLGSGTINDPKNKYHLEVMIKEKEIAYFLIDMLKNLNINVKIFEKISKVSTTLKEVNNPKNFKISLYIKESEEISKFLALIGANKAVMHLEDIRIEKEMKSKVNRIVNCKSANLSKTINAAIEQITAIKKIKEKGKFNDLDDNMKEIANIRIENPDISLIELGNMLDKKLGKSGVNYRLKKIVEIANEL